ncbi:hypothetical protein PVK06_030596 [Gossypium arboreum]|uniref:Uncharacterized protein n=1 Tax=Gossypium arboreum TaxID=29729 RepID=A0ABR0NNQ8_GOSAR|nr:hypothetical protein PVK06_030596 [Gossypium arboreum]
MASTEQLMKLYRSIIGHTLYTKYTKLREKQIKELNKCQQEMTAALASSQRKSKLTTQQEIGQSTHPKLD